MNPDPKKVNPPAYSEGKPGPGSGGTLTVSESGTSPHSSTVTPSSQLVMEKKSQATLLKDEKAPTKEEQVVQAETVAE
jgi:hypothetical protein